MLIDLEKDLSNFKLDILNSIIRIKKIKEYLEIFRRLELARNEYRKVVQENNLLKREILGPKQQQQSRAKQIKRKYIVESSDSETNSLYESNHLENEEKEEVEFPRIKEKKVKQKL